MSDQDITDDATNVPHLLPGGTLRQAREQKGLTLGEVSGALKFSVRQIEALENDDFQQLQGKTFLRGFIRAYARLLKLPPDPLLEMLGEQSLPSPEQIVVPANMGETDPIPFYRRHAKKLGFAAILLLLAGSMIWFAGTQPAMEHLVSPPPIVDIAPKALPDGGQPTPANDAAAPTQELPPAAISPPAEPATTLSFEFSGRSWLEVKDASGQVLLTGEFSDGQKQVITGKPPYQLWIGRVSAVKVSYGGHDVDLQPHAREDVARFTLE